MSLIQMQCQPVPIKPVLRPTTFCVGPSEDSDSTEPQRATDEEVRHAKPRRTRRNKSVLPNPEHNLCREHTSSTEASASSGGSVLPPEFWEAVQVRSSHEASADVDSPKILWSCL
eukprot:gnl/MRDRNA2_/MRDRNA2_151379_c0_seq1.p1 gnl/MRDRNA2_/MRDRNA2_151379_c0~~gnl/MRDRNA2_/MRDRNA2_151379_c0_seq1.p1  ORF type:complete len:115 (-),score=16.17 gnl/MRDRNA2_/MRDRNA2_151379_c0_seq1:100-444(-)